MEKIAFLITGFSLLFAGIGAYFYMLPRLTLVKTMYKEVLWIKRPFSVLINEPALFILLGIICLSAIPFVSDEFSVKRIIPFFLSMVMLIVAIVYLMEISLFKVIDQSERENS